MSTETAWVVWPGNSAPELVKVLSDTGPVDGMHPITVATSGPSPRRATAYRWLDAGARELLGTVPRAFQTQEDARAWLRRN